MNCGPKALFRLRNKDRKCWHGGGRFRRWEETCSTSMRSVWVRARFSTSPETSNRLGHPGALNYLHARQEETLPSFDPRCPDLPDRRLSGVFHYWLQEVTPGAHLQLERTRDAGALTSGFTFDRPGKGITRRYRDKNSGFGLSCTLPVLAALLSPPGSLCLIENPEAHLHPRGQTRLADLAVRASLAGVQVIAETHSDHFMDGVRIAVREELIRPDQTAFHYFEREGGATVVSSPQVDADGRISFMAGRVLRSA